MIEKKSKMLNTPKRRNNMTDITYSGIINFIQYVVDWNEVILDKDASIESRMELQKTITLSEVQETIDAFNDNDKQEIVDGVGDVLVTAGYMIYLKEGNMNFLDYTFSFTTKDLLNEMSFESLLMVIKQEVINEHISYYNLQLLAAYVINMFGREYVVPYLNAILKSNDSKFVRMDQWDEKKEADHVEKKYKGKFDNIVGVPRKFRGEDVMLLRADFGRGKLLKPTVFVEPTDILVYNA